MPLVAVFEPDPSQIGSDAPRPEQVRHVVGVLAGLAHWPPAARLAGHRAHILRMAIPTTLAQIHTATELLDGGVIARLGPGPFELTEVGANHGGHVSGPRGRLEKGQNTLGDEGEEEEQ